MNFLKAVAATLVGILWFGSAVGLAVFAITGADPVMHGGYCGGQCWPVWVCVAAGVLAVVDIATLAVFFSGWKE